MSEPSTEPMAPADRLLVFATAVLPPGLVVGAGVILGLRDSYDAHVLGWIVAAVVGALWLLPALRDLFAARVIVAVGEVTFVVHELSSGRSYLYCQVGDAPKCPVGFLRARRLKALEGRRVRAVIAPRSRRLLHWRPVG